MNTTVSPITARLAVPLFVCLSVIAGRPTVAVAEESVLFMFVMNQSGQPVLDVSADELHLQQGGAECEIVSVQPETEGMKIALLVDTSPPAAPSLTSLRAGLRAFFETLPDGHEVGLFTIAGQTRLRVDFTTDRAALLEQTENLFAESSGGVVLLDGLVETWDRRFDEDDPWPVFVVVVYDGAETSGSVRMDEFNAFVEELRFRGATAHAVLVSTRSSGVQTDVLVNITNNTGGIYKVLTAATALPVTLTELATSMGAHYDEVKNRYRMIFECEPDNLQAQIGLRVDRPAVGVRLFADRRPSPDFEAASAGLEAAASGLDATREDLFNLGELEFAKGDVDAAAQWYEKAAMVDPNWGDPLFKLALVALNKGDMETAKQFFEKVIAVAPNSEEAVQAKATLDALP